MSWKAIILSIAILAVVKADFPVRNADVEEIAPLLTVERNNDQVYRLPTNVVPLEYKIFLDLYFAETTDRPFSYDGREYITIQVSFSLFYTFRCRHLLKIHYLYTT